MNKHHTEITASVNHIVVNVLFFKSGNWCVAQCLEYDIAAQGKTLEQTIEAFENTLVIQLAAYAEITDDPYDELIRQAPHDFFELWKGRCHQFESKPPVRIDVPAINTEVWICPKVLLDEDVDPNHFRSEWNRRKR